jgi:hypothetical protein
MFNLTASSTRTIGDLVRKGQTIRLCCRSCQRSAERPPAAIAAFLGADLPLQRYIERSVCPCGARYPDIELIAAPENPAWIFDGEGRVFVAGRRKAGTGSRGAGSQAAD